MLRISKSDSPRYADAVEGIAEKCNVLNNASLERRSMGTLIAFITTLRMPVSMSAHLSAYYIRSMRLISPRELHLVPRKHFA